MEAIKELKKTVARLRSPGGCPWDQEQTHQSLALCLIEECCEVLDALDRKDMANLKEELGDVLLQVVMHAQMAEEQGLFDLEQVAAGINQKLIRRHPHVFEGKPVADSAAVLEQWDAIKAAEKKASGVAGNELFKDLPACLPALLFAREVFKQVDKKKLPAADWIDAQKVAKKAEGLDEHQAGKELFELTAACRHSGIDPESALRRYARALMADVEKRVADR